MECDILISNLKNPEITALMKENVGNMSDGSSSHYTGALKLGLEKAFELKKRERSVQLLCHKPSCGWYDIHVSYSFRGSGTRCPGCRCYMRCTGCNFVRDGIYESCQSCGKRFI